MKIDIPAKINLNLFITGSSGGYHVLSSVFASVGLFDTVWVKKRRDKKIVLKESGIKSGVIDTENNAYKSAKLFMEEYNVNGVNIKIKKRIPVAQGLGGSSADSAGVILLMQKLYGIDNADYVLTRAGSDVKYMATGGYALVSGKGEKVKPIDFYNTLYLNVIPSPVPVSTKKCYDLFDEMGKKSKPFSIKEVKDLIELKENKFINSLYVPASTLNKEIEVNLGLLEKTKPFVASMTGSGSAVFAVYKSKEERDQAFTLLKEQNPLTLKLNTIPKIK